LYDVQRRLIVADGKYRLLVGTPLDFSQKVREFLIGSQWVAFFFVYFFGAPRIAGDRPFFYRSTGRSSRRATSSGVEGILAKHLTRASRARKRRSGGVYHAVYRDILLDQSTLTR
jgi:hypothetical protein